MSHSSDEDDARQREARAILERVRRETEPQIGGHTEALLLRTRSHLMAKDVDPGDRIEVIGTRIARAAALVVFAVLAFLLVTQTSFG